MTHPDPPIKQEKIILVSFVDKKRVECDHHSIVVDENLWRIECADCGEMLDPIRFTHRLAVTQEKWRFRGEQEKEWYEQISARRKEKSRCKCRHCGKMTSIGN